MRVRLVWAILALGLFISVFIQLDQTCSSDQLDLLWLVIREKHAQKHLIGCALYAELKCPPDSTHQWYIDFFSKNISPCWEREEKRAIPCCSVVMYSLWGLHNDSMSCQISLYGCVDFRVTHWNAWSSLGPETIVMPAALLNASSQHAHSGINLRESPWERISRTLFWHQTFIMLLSFFRDNRPVSHTLTKWTK